MSKDQQTGWSRRDLLRGAAVSAVLGLPLLSSAARRIGASTGRPARARRLLILNLMGGVRSSAAFHASAQIPYNPYGLMAPVNGTPPFVLGRLLDDTTPGLPPLPDADYVLGSKWQHARLPRLREIATQFSVLGTYSTDRGDHERARIEEPTGNASGGDPGLLTRVAAGLDAAGLAPSAPPFHLSPSALFGNARGALNDFVPVSLASYASLPRASNVDQLAIQRTGNGFATSNAMRDAFDQSRVATRHNVAKLVTGTLARHRSGARVMGARLAQPDMEVAAPGSTAALGTVVLPGNQSVALENSMLFELFTRCAGPAYQDQAINAALAIRLLQLGSPAVTLELPNFDFHSGERANGPPIYAFLGRLWAALRWLLPRIPDPSGSGSLFDNTLVLTMSDFGRDKGAANGWNGGEGTDHGADHACFYLGHAVMGAGTTPNKLVGPVDTRNYNAKLSSIRYSSRELLVTLLDALGLDPHDDTWGLPTGGNPIEELWT